MWCLNLQCSIRSIATTRSFGNLYRSYHEIDKTKCHFPWPNSHGFQHFLIIQRWFWVLFGAVYTTILRVNFKKVPAMVPERNPKDWTTRQAVGIISQPIAVKQYIFDTLGWACHYLPEQKPREVFCWSEHQCLSPTKDTIHFSILNIKKYTLLNSNLIETRCSLLLHNFARRSK